jgi:hypothetical protein
MNNPFTQLCLFNDQVMQSMEEQPPKLAADPQFENPAWLAWQLMIGEGLRGKSWRAHRRMFFSGKKRRSRLQCNN